LNNVVAGTGRVDPSGTFVGLVDPSLMRSGVNTVDALISTGGGPFQTVDVLGAVKWTLGSSAPHRTLTGSNGIIAQETPGAIVGVASMDVSASSHLVIVSGWATLPHQAGVVDIVVVRNGVSIDTGSTGGERPDVAAVLKEPTITDSGFNLSIPVSQTGDPAKVTLEVFAVQGNQMTELAYFAGTQYRGAPAKTAPAATTTTAAT
jgi:hypothetical protein